MTATTRNMTEIAERSPASPSNLACAQEVKSHRAALSHRSTEAQRVPDLGSDLARRATSTTSTNTRAADDSKLPIHILACCRLTECA